MCSPPRPPSIPFPPDLAIVDVRLPPGPDGLALARHLRTVDDLPIIFVTAADAPHERLAGFAAGGDDYLIKPFLMAELLARVGALLRRSGRLRSNLLVLGDLVIDEDARTVVRAGALVALTPTEFDLLLALARHQRKVLSKLQLLSQVRGYEAYDPNLVEVHISALRRKLEAHGPRIVHTVRGTGYVARA
ncbi:MAG: winged helix-turn-helix domain-containing protein [Acidimicrobiia bacterium]